MARRAAPELALAAGALLVAVLAAVVAADVVTVAFDETLHKQSAVRYTRGLANVLDDPTARATARLYPLVLSPLFAVLEGDAAVRAGRALGALLFCSAAAPAYLLAREVVASRALAAGAALLSVAAPWLALTTVLYTEVLAYPVALWALLAVLRALRAPSPRADLLVLVLVAVAIAARTQLAALGLGYVLAIVLLRRRELRRFGWTLAALALAVAVGLAAVATGAAREALGGYAGIFDRAGLPTDAVLAALVEVVDLGVGVGIVPAVVALAWYATALAGPDRPERHFARVTALVLGVLFATTIWAQGGFLGPNTEERYYVYAVPCAWIATVAAVESRAVGRPALLVAGGAVTLLFGSVTLAFRDTAEGWFLSPAAIAVTHLVRRVTAPVAGLSSRDVLFVVAAALVLAAAAAWTRGARARLLAVVALPAVLQLALTAYVLAGARGDLPGTPQRTGSGFAGLAWIDHALPAGTNATWLVSQPVPEAEGAQRTTVFWNDQIGRVAMLAGTGLPPAAEPLNALPAGPWPAPGDAPVVQTAGSPFAQLAGRRLARSPDGRLELVAPVAGAAPAWTSARLTPDAWVQAGVPVAVALGGAPAPVRLELAGVPGQATSVRIELGGAPRVVALPAAPAGARVAVTVAACARTGTLTAERTGVLPDTRGVAARLVAARVGAGASSSLCRRGA